MEGVKLKPAKSHDRLIFLEESLVSLPEPCVSPGVVPDQDSFADLEGQIRDEETNVCAENAAAAKTQSVPALERALNILEFLAQSQRGVTHSQLTRRLQLPRSTCHALLLTFQRCGYIERDQKTGRYRLRFKLYTLANKSLNSVRLRDQSAPVLQKLMWDTRSTVQMAVLVEGEAVLIDRIDPPGAPTFASWLGKPVGLHCTALGKALLAQLPEDQACEFALKQGLLRHNENTITSLKKLKQACEISRQVGYAIDDQEGEIGIRGIGVPVLNSRGELLAAISVSGMAAQMENISLLARKVKLASERLTNCVDEMTHSEAGQPVIRVSNIVPYPGGTTELDSASALLARPNVR